MPKPSPNEDRSTFISRCIPELRREGKPQDQAVAQCQSIWQQNRSEKEEENHE